MAEDLKNANGKDGDILARARKDWERAELRERDNIRLAYDDLNFLAGDQWPREQRVDREMQGRPVLTINQLPQFVHQITGDIRQMKPAIKVVPVDSAADEKIADLRAGLIRYIENRSDASAVYFRAADSQVACGIGHWRVTTEYADGSTFNQEIRISPIEDGVGVLWDPDAILPTREDAGYCFVPVDMSRAAFEEKYPDHKPDQFADSEWAHNAQWCTEDYVRVAEYWLKKPAKKKLGMLPDGAILDLTDAEQDAIDKALTAGARIEDRKSYKVCRYLITASAVLEGPQEWAGRYIPIVPVVGEETRIGRKIIRKGIVRDAQDAQRMSNYFHSAHTETVALQPKAPFLVTENNVAKYQEVWEQANTQNLPYLPYEPDTKNGGAAPQRVQPPVSSQGILDGLTMAKEDMRAIIGIYDASLGAKSNETSGKAILARQREGDVGSYLYIDNFARAVRHTGNIINDLIPHYYDTQRTIRIMGEDGKIDVLEINKAKGVQGVSTLYDNDLTIGAYDVVAQMGPSFTTRREEAREGMVSFVQAAPQAAPIILDLIAKAQDWPMADDIAKRIRTQLPPNILQMEELEKQGATPEQIQQLMQQQAQNQPPPPEVMKMQIDAQAKQADQQIQVEKAQADIQLKQAEIAMQERAAERQAQLEMAKLEQEARFKEAELAQQAQLERERMMIDAQTKREIAEIQASVKVHGTHVAAETARHAAEQRQTEDA